jgi:hypothetical protein
MALDLTIHPHESIGAPNVIVLRLTITDMIPDRSVDRMFFLSPPFD